MIQIINNSKIVNNLKNQGYNIIDSPEKEFDKILAYCNGINAEIEKIIHEVEGSEVKDNKLISKFSGEFLDINKLSGGSKSVVAVYFRARLVPNNKDVLDITGCGSNAIEYILNNYGDADLKLIVNHFELPYETKVKVMFNNVVLNSLYELFSEDEYDEEDYNEEY